MRNRLHENPQHVLARNLGAVLRRKELSVRALERQMKSKGSKISNRTIQNMVNGTGDPGLDNLQEVATALKVPLWQLMCPGADLSEEAVHDLLEAFGELSEIGRHAIEDQVQARLLLERSRRPPPSDADSGSALST